MGCQPGMLELQPETQLLALAYGIQRVVAKMASTGRKEAAQKHHRLVVQQRGQAPEWQKAALTTMRAYVSRLAMLPLSLSILPRACVW